MADVFDVAKRRQIMQAVRGRNTTPEKIVGRVVRSLGFRFRQNVTNIPGKPDLVFSRRRKIIFIRGCFWHRHSCRKGRSLPSTNRAFWAAKLAANKKRDIAVRRKLRRLGWKVLVVWECQTTKRNHAHLEKRIAAFLQPNNRTEL